MPTREPPSPRSLPWVGTFPVAWSRQILTSFIVRIFIISNTHWNLTDHSRALETDYGVNLSQPLSRHWSCDNCRVQKFMIRVTVKSPPGHPTPIVGVRIVSCWVRVGVRGWVLFTQAYWSNWCYFVGCTSRQWLGWKRQVCTPTQPTPFQRWSGLLWYVRERMRTKGSETEWQSLSGSKRVNHL